MSAVRGQADIIPDAVSAVEENGAAGKNRTFGLALTMGALYP